MARRRRNYSKGARGRAQYRARLKKMRASGRKFIKIGRRRHKISALLGGKRRRRSASKRRSRGKRRAARRNPLLQALGNPTRRRRRRNAWNGSPLGHSRAAKKGWATRRRRKHRGGGKRRRSAGRRRYSSRWKRGYVPGRYYSKKSIRRHRRVAAGLSKAFEGMGRLNPRRRRRKRRNGSHRRTYRRFHARRNPGFGGMGNLKSLAKQAATFGAGYLGARALGNVAGMGLGKVVGFLPAGIQSKLAPHTPLLSAIASVLLTDQATRRVAFLRKYRTPLMIGAGIQAFMTVVNQYVAPKLVATAPGLAKWVGLGAVPAYWSTPPYVEYAQGLGGMGEYVEVPPGVGLSGLMEAAGEYVEVPPGVGGIPAGYEGHRIAGAPTGMMPVPRTLSPGEAAYESQNAGDDGLFEREYGIFG